MAHTVISTDRTTTATVSSNDVWILNQGINLFPDSTAAGMEGTDVVQAFIQIYGNIVTEFGSGTENGITLDGVSNTNQIHIAVGASIFGGAAGIAINGSKNSIGNSGSIDAWGASGMLIAGDENVIVNRGSIEGFGGAISISGTNNNIINYGTLNTSSTDLDFGAARASVEIDSTEGQSTGLKNHGTISSLGVDISGGEGNEAVRNTGTIVGNINLGGGDDVLTNGSGRIEGDVDLGDGNDQYIGGPGDFVNGVTGGLGNDTYFLRGHLTAVVEAVDGGTSDTVQIDVSATLAANVENLFLVGGEDISGRGNVLANQIVGNGGDNRLYGGGGADILLGGVGADLLNGGSGSDTADYEDSDEGVVVNLAKNTASGGSADGDKFVSIENLYGSGLADVLTGSTASNVILGLAGADKLDGGKGNDFLTGGDGKDTFVFAKGYNHDTIEDFQLNGASADQINLHALKAQFSNFADIKAHHMTDHGSDVDITFGTDTLTIINVHKADLTTGDFIL